MFKKSITYENFNGEKVTEDFYFHMTKAELMSMAAEGDALMARIRRIMDAKDAKAIIAEFRSLIEQSVGLRSEDNNRFIKSDEARSRLFDSPAFDELLMELCTSAEAASEFTNNLVPEKMRTEMGEQLKKLAGNENAPDPFTTVEGNKDERPAWEKEDREPTKQELASMSTEELQRAFTRRLHNKA